MDKITFESVMEEIKKSLGEARLMSIEEAMNLDEDSMDDEAKKFNDAIKNDVTAGSRAGSPVGGDTPAPAATPAPVKPATGTGAKGIGSDAVQSAMDKPVNKSVEPTPVPSVKSGVGGGSLGFGAQGGTAGAKPVAPATPLSKPDTPTAPRASTPAASSATRAPSAPKPSAPAAVDTAAIYKKHGVGGSDEDSGAFHRAEAEIATARKATPSAPAARPSAPSAPRPATPSAPRPASQGGAIPTPPPRPMSSLSASGQAVAKQYSGKVGTDDSGNNPMPTEVPQKATPVDKPTGSDVNGWRVGTNPVGGVKPSFAQPGYDPTNKKPFVAPKPGATLDKRTSLQKFMPKVLGGLDPPSTMQENFDQFVKKFLKESK